MFKKALLILLIFAVTAGILYTKVDRDTEADIEAFVFPGDVVLKEVSKVVLENSLGVQTTTTSNVSDDKGHIGQLTEIKFESNSGNATYRHIALVGNADRDTPIMVRYYSGGEFTPYREHRLIEGSHAQFIEAPSRDYFFSSGQFYELYDGYTERLSAGALAVSPEVMIESNRLNFQLPVKEGVLSEYWFIESQMPLVYWNNAKEVDLLARMDFDLTRQFSVLGNMYPVPDSYSGVGENHFYHNHAYHVGNKLLVEGASLFSKLFSQISANHLMTNMPEGGYFMTPMMSSWLGADYGLGYAFYDTRFNADAAQFLVNTYKKTRDWTFLEAAEKHIAFFKVYCDQYKIPTSDRGYLVMDYTDFSGSGVIVHASLNHILAEAVLLYDYHMATGDQKSRQIADELLQGIEDLGEGWVKENGDLWYAYHPEKGFILQDYIDVTLNDLRTAQQTYFNVYGKEFEFINYLIDVKLKYVNSVIGK
ncbi:MAG: hypothetical protein LCH34_04570 [Firmicutes bacterium]|nr:hypothetical protein [Bacillota bacterium]